MKSSRFYTSGNFKILNHHKTAFLCSRTCPAHIILKAYDWACEQRDLGNCIISGFHSQIEKDVFHFLLKGEQPIILVLARGLKRRWEREIKEAIDAQKLLILTPFADSVERVTSRTAARRNAFMAEVADEILVAYAAPGGNIEKLIHENVHRKIRVTTLSAVENQHWIKEGVAVYD